MLPSIWLVFIRQPVQSEVWWMNQCIQRVNQRAGDVGRERAEVARLMHQIPRDIKHIPEWLGWLKGVGIRGRSNT